MNDITRRASDRDRCLFPNAVRNAAFMIILSPMARLTREATDTSRRRCRNSAT